MPGPPSSRRVWRNTVCAVRPRCSPPAPPWLRSRADSLGYQHSLRPCLGTSIAPGRRAAFRQTRLGAPAELLVERASVGVVGQPTARVMVEAELVRVDVRPEHRRKARCKLAPVVEVEHHRLELAFVDRCEGQTVQLDPESEPLLTLHPAALERAKRGFRMTERKEQ